MDSSADLSNSRKKMQRYRRCFVLFVVIFAVVVSYCVYNGSLTGRMKSSWKSTFHDRQDNINRSLFRGTIQIPQDHDAAQSLLKTKDTTTIFVIGDSHIYRLGKDIKGALVKNASLDFGLPNRSVTIFGIPGGSVDILRNSEVLISLYQSKKPQFVLLHVGGNDADSAIPVNQVCSNILKYSAEIESVYGVKFVLLSEQFNRKQPRNIPRKDYDMKIIELNTILRFHESKRFWSHVRLMQAKKEILSEDGVHLNSYGRERFYLSVKDALQYLQTVLY